MKKESVVVLLVLLFFFSGNLIGCSPVDIPMRASLVKSVTAEQSHYLEYECQYLGEVLGFSSWSLFRSKDVAHNNALNELLDNAAELGATHVFVNRGNYSTLRGEAYLCSYCRLPGGTPDISVCRDEQNRDINGLNRITCEKKGFQWHLRALNQETCIERNGVWLPDYDVLRLMPVQIPTNNRKQP